MGAARRLLLTALILIIGPLWAGGSLTIYLHELSVIQAPLYALGDIAAVSSDDPALQKELEALPLGPAPLFPSFLSAAWIRGRIAKTFSGRVDIIGSGTAAIPAGSAIPKGRERLAARLLAFLDREGGGEDRMEIEFLSPLPEAGAEVVFALGTARRVQGLLAGRVQVLSQGGGLFVWVHRYLPVARAARDLMKGELLAAADIDYVETDVSALSGRFFNSGELEGSFRVAAPIAYGSVLTGDSLTRNYLVRAGDPVTVVFIRPGLSVSVPGKAYGSGARGDTVEVRPLDAKKRFWGKVSASGEVVVEKL